MSLVPVAKWSLPKVLTAETRVCLLLLPITIKHITKTQIIYQYPTITHYTFITSIEKQAKLFTNERRPYLDLHIS